MNGKYEIAEIKYVIKVYLNTQPNTRKVFYYKIHFNSNTITKQVV